MITRTLKIPKKIWVKILLELKKKSFEETESGAFLLGPINKNKITKFICYDDLDPECRKCGYIYFKGEKYIKLWEICEKERLKVYADIHTHPSSWVEQSSTDSSHPMISQPGHIALILPNYGKDGIYFKKIGVYEYQGNYKWIKYNSLSKKVQFTWL